MSNVEPRSADAGAVRVSVMPGWMIVVECVGALAADTAGPASGVAETSSVPDHGPVCGAVAEHVTVCAGPPEGSEKLEGESEVHELSLAATVGRSESPLLLTVKVAVTGAPGRAYGVWLVRWASTAGWISVVLCDSESDTGSTTSVPDAVAAPWRGFCSPSEGVAGAVVLQVPVTEAFAASVPNDWAQATSSESLNETAEMSLGPVFVIWYWISIGPPCWAYGVALVMTRSSGVAFSAASALPAQPSAATVTASAAIPFRAPIGRHLTCGRCAFPPLRRA